MNTLLASLKKAYGLEVKPITVEYKSQSHDLFIKELNGDRRSVCVTAFLSANKPDAENTDLVLVVNSLCDAEGNMLINSDEEKAELANNMPGGLLVAISEEASILNGFKEADVENAKKSSSKTPKKSSGSK